MHDHLIGSYCSSEEGKTPLGPSAFGSLAPAPKGGQPISDLALDPNPAGSSGPPSHPFIDAPSVPGPAMPPKFSLSFLWPVRWWMLATFVGVCAILLPCIWLFIKPVYKATALTRVAPRTERIAFKNEDNSGSSLYTSFVNTQVSIIRAGTVLQRVLDRSDVRNSHWYQNPPKTLWGPQPTHIERLMEAMTIKAHRDSQLIQVSVRAERSGDAKILANAILDEHERFTSETTRESDVLKFETLLDERARLQKELDGLINTKYGIAKQLGTTTPEDLRSQLVTHLSTLEEQYAQLQRAHSITLQDLKWFEQHGKERTSTPDSDESTSDKPKGNSTPYALDMEWRRLDMNFENARHELELARQQFGVFHPQIAKLQSNLTHAERMLRARELQLEDQARLSATTGGTGTEGTGEVLSAELLQRKVKRQEREIALLEEEINLQREKVSKTGDLARDLAQLVERIRRKRELEQQLDHRLAELELEGKAPARIRVEAHAVEPSQPDGDRRVLLNAMAVVGALMCGLGVGYARSMLDPRIREIQDVQHSPHIPFLGHLPPLPTTTNLFEGCSSFLAESVRIVRTSLLERFATAGKGAVLITSTTSQTGKTSLAALLAHSLSDVGKKTLLVEADLRRPSLAMRLGQDHPQGLAAVLSGKVGEHDAIVTMDGTSCDVLFAGEIQDDFDPEWLATGRFESLLEKWKQHYDFVLIDAPPILPVADARILVRMTHGAIMVLRTSHTRRTDVMRAVGDLLTAGGRLLGTVLIGVQPGTGYGQGYGYGSTYHLPDNRRKSGIKTYV